MADIPGPGVDAQGQAVVDPTKNVLDLVDASVRRLDDLRAASDAHNNELRRVRAEYERELRAADQELRRAETQRIDAIRAVDQGNVQRASEVAATQAATLAAQQALSAETLRTQVATTAFQATQALAAALDPIQKDIADLRRAQYEQQGSKTQTAEQRLSVGSIVAVVGLIAVILFGAAGVAIALIVR